MKLESLLDNRKYFYIMHLSYGAGTDEDKRKHWEFGKDSNLIGLDRVDVNFDWNEQTEADKKEFGSLNPNWYRQFETFCNKMKRGDLVVVIAGLDSILGIGEIARNDYYYCPKLKKDRTFFDHIRNVTWKKAWSFEDRNRPFLLQQLMVFNDTLRKITPNSPFWKILCNVEI